MTTLTTELQSTTICGASVILRELRPSEVGGPYLQWMNDAETTRFLESRFRTWTQEDLVAFVERDMVSPSACLFAIRIARDGTHIGNIRLSEINTHHGCCDVGILIGESVCRGQGYGTEAIRLACHYAFDTLGLDRLTAAIYETNSASRRAFEKAGFLEEGRLAGRWVDQGRRVDGFVYGMTRSQLDSISGNG